MRARRSATYLNRSKHLVVDTRAIFVIANKHFVFRIVKHRDCLVGYGIERDGTTKYQSRFVVAHKEHTTRGLLAASSFALSVGLIPASPSARQNAEPFHSRTPSTPRHSSAMTILHAHIKTPLFSADWPAPSGGAWPSPDCGRVRTRV